MKPPKNSRRVLTWQADRNGLESWVIDSCYRNTITKKKFWYEADAWKCKVLYWQELPPPPDIGTQSEVCAACKDAKPDPLGYHCSCPIYRNWQRCCCR